MRRWLRATGIRRRCEEGRCRRGAPAAASRVPGQPLSKDRTTAATSPRAAIARKHAPAHEARALPHVKSPASWVLFPERRQTGGRWPQMRAGAMEAVMGGPGRKTKPAGRRHMRALCPLAGGRSSVRRDTRRCVGGKRRRGTPRSGGSSARAPLEQLPRHVNAPAKPLVAGGSRTGGLSSTRGRGRKVADPGKSPHRRREVSRDERAPT